MAMVGDAGVPKKRLLWTFLLQLLKDRADIIAWTGRDRGQFRLIDAQEVSSIILYLTRNSVSPNWPVCLWLVTQEEMWI